MNPLIPNNVIEPCKASAITRNTNGRTIPTAVGEWIMEMDQALEKAWCAWLNGDRNSNEALEEIRQVTAVGIAAMQEHGALMRLPSPGPDAMIGQDDANSPVKKKSDTRTAMDIDRERQARADADAGALLQESRPAPTAGTPADQGAFGSPPLANSQ
jgi:hypothetical protein